MRGVTAVVRFVTLVDFDDGDADEPRHMSVQARHEAEVADGRRLVLFDRGWSSGLHGELPDGADIWSLTPVADVEQLARVFVGPDEPPEGRSQEDAEADYWVTVADLLRDRGFDVAIETLRRLPHDVVLSERLRRRLGA
jgi:hypothetical protein